MKKKTKKKAVTVAFKKSTSLISKAALRPSSGHASLWEWAQRMDDAYDAFRKGLLSVAEIKAISIMANHFSATIALRQEQARLSGARVVGDVIMNVQGDPNAVPSTSSIERHILPPNLSNGKKRSHA